MEQHLGYPKHDAEGSGSGNSRNGVTGKTVRGDFGEVGIETPRDRDAAERQPVEIVTEVMVNYTLAP